MRGRISTISTASRWPGYSSQLVTVASWGGLTVTFGGGRGADLGGEQAVSTVAHKAVSSNERDPFMGHWVLHGAAELGVEADDGFIGIGNGVWESTDCDQGNRLITFVVHLPHRIRVEGWHPVHEELVLMVAMGKLHPNDPTAIRHPRHRMGRRLPPVKVTNQENTLSLRGAAEEVH